MSSSRPRVSFRRDRCQPVPLTEPVEQQRMAAPPPPARVQADLQGRRDAMLSISTKPRDVTARGRSRAMQGARTQPPGLGVAARHRTK